MSFDMGKVVMTQTINSAIADSGQFAKEVLTSLRRYARYDWGDMCHDDKSLNDNAVKSGLDRIVAAYVTGEGKIYIITEHDRSYTTILFADEY